MPPVDFRDDAKAREIAKLRRAGLNPDGSPIKKPKPGADTDDDEGGEDDDQGDEDETDEERERRETEEDGGDADDDDGGVDADTKAEIEDLRRQLAALNGRVGPAQRNADEYQRLYTGERQERERETRELNARIEALNSQLEARETTIDPKELLSEDELADIDPKVIDVVMKLAQGIAKKMTPKVDPRSVTLEVLAERETRQVADYRTQVLTDPARGLHQLGTLAYDQKFIDWSQGEDNDIDSVMQSLLNAKSTAEIDRYAKIVAKRIARFKEASKGGKEPTDPNRSLNRHMRRKSGERLTKAEADAKLARARTLMRSRNPADQAEAKKILDSLK